MSEAALALKELRKTFHQGRSDLHVLNGAALEVAGGEMVALVGPSGSGKSTLMHIAGLLERPDAGSVVIQGRDASKAGDGERTRVRRASIGFVYQHHHLLPEFSARENVVLPQMIAGTARSKARTRAGELLELVGLAERLDHRPAELSGGEQQRVAIARALANEPSVLLADEPTGNLDPTTSDRVFAALTQIVRESGVAALVATHNLDLAGQMDRTVRLQDGALVAV
ncbi:ABC transporter ATP-binding protein [Rhodovibrio salinarum]|uniref:ABC transporter ATP-binding protein n=1 Tax=Rhodovibrio salinarum TaxID=1087 RepID=A0A934V145_9PROT|nr:ABC transporter ATP-binding protein [Rhodovibrio salinarum]MBK1697799.1 ABC transporter ATP-binding protein [Rhodovibrio salinarum]